MGDQEYQKLEHKEHVLTLPDTYIGSVDKTTDELWYLNENKMIKKNLTYIPGEFKLFDEIIVNSLDQYVRMKKAGKGHYQVTQIDIVVDKESGTISVKNNGDGISVAMHKKEKIYIPELIFGNLLTSSNYNQQELKHVGGKNGYGAKLANIFSTQFTIETVDKNTKQKFVQSFYDNMSRKDEPSITKYTGLPYTQITYHPDYKRFKTSGLSDDMIKIMEKRAYDMAACTDSNVNVTFNGEKIATKSFEKYIDLYIGSDKKDNPRAYEKVSERWEISAALNPSLSFEQISFVNGIHTFKGGKHVDYITNQITKKLAEFIKKKKKLDIKPNYIKENIIVFVKSTIDNPSFNSQTKDCLTTNASKFGSKCEISDKFIDALSKCGIIERAIELNTLKENKDLKKSDGKKMNRIRGIPKLDDANWAGTKKSKYCTLILTEGDSAKSMALAGLSVVGRDKYGVFPLKGKLLNVRDENNMKKLLENDEISNIKQIIGLQTGKKYKNVEDLRYGSILILTDQDEDGSHIKGLIFNMFQTLWPTLFSYPGFIKSMLTPVIKARKAKQMMQFYSVKDYNSWKVNNEKGWDIKYYKGLGTSTPKEAKEYFKDLKLIEYLGKEDADNESIHLAFSKNKNSADKRKEWLMSYDNKNTLDYSKKRVSVKDFIYQDMIHFSNSDNVRSIPNINDGLKPSQRKILYCCFKRNLTNEVRVAQLAGYVSEHGAYHHGETSLHGTIVNMAQDFIGSNNINLLEPIGQFGSRIQGGSDAAQPRYIHTKISEITNHIYNKMDNPLYVYNDDDGLKVEPQYYMPIIPMLLVNGSQGIGTGWSTEIPCHNPYDIIRNIRLYLKGEPLIPMKPWYNGFKGNISKIKPNVYQTKGNYEVDDLNDKVTVTELPIGLWTQKYKDYLESIIVDKNDKSPKKKNYIKHYNSYCTDTEINFEIIFPKAEIYDYLKMDGSSNITKLEKILKLVNTISTTNMHYYNSDFNIKKASCVEDILIEYCNDRLELYEKRRLYQIGVIEDDINSLMIKIRFINDFINEKIIIIKKKRSEIIEQLENMEYPKSSQDGYDYLLKMPIYNLTQDKIDEFNEKLKNKEEDLNKLQITNKNEMWLNELLELEQYLSKNNYSKRETKKIIKKTVAKKKVVKKTK